MLQHETRLSLRRTQKPFSVLSIETALVTDITGPGVVRAGVPSGDPSPNRLETPQHTTPPDTRTAQ